MLAALYVGYIIVLAKLKPALMPPLSQEERRVALPSFAQRLSHSGDRALTPVRGLKGRRNADVPTRTMVFQLGIAVLPALVVVLFMGLIYAAVTAPPIGTFPVCSRWERSMRALTRCRPVWLSRHRLKVRSGATDGRCCQSRAD